MHYLFHRLKALQIAAQHYGALNCSTAVLFSFGSDTVLGMFSKTLQQYCLGGTRTASARLPTISSSTCSGVQHFRHVKAPSTAQWLAQRGYVAQTRKQIQRSAAAFFATHSGLIDRGAFLKRSHRQGRLNAATAPPAEQHIVAQPGPPLTGTNGSNSSSVISDGHGTGNSKCSYNGTSSDTQPQPSAPLAAATAASPPAVTAAVAPPAAGHIPHHTHRRSWPRPRRSTRHSTTTQQALVLPQQQRQMDMAGPQPQRQLHQHTQQQQMAPVAEAGDVSVRGIVRNITYQDDKGFKIVKLKVLEGFTDPSCPPAVLTAGNAALAAASGRASSKRGSNSNSSLLAVKGTMPEVKQKDEVELRGKWVNHGTFGWQISVCEISVVPPTDPEQQLVSCIKGVGAATAQRIVAGLGAEHVKAVLNSADAVKRLSAIKGIGKKKAESFKREWDAHTGTLEAYTWLFKEHKLPASIARNISLIYGAATCDVVTQNPYALITSVPAFNLQHAEVLAASVGLPADAPERAAAVLHHVLMSAAQNDSVDGLMWQQLQSRALDKLAELGRHHSRPWPEGLSLNDGAEMLIDSQQVVVEEAQVRSDHHSLPIASATDANMQQVQGQPPQLLEFVLVERNWSDSALFMMKKLYDAEKDVLDFYVAASEACHKAIARLHKPAGKSTGRKTTSSSSTGSSSTDGSTLPYPLGPISSEVSEWITQCESELSQELGMEVILNDGQRQALALAASLPALVLTGGPGCGKTLTSQAVARAWLDRAEQLNMAAPTGRAAQRLQEMVSGFKYKASASTIHRLLGYRGRKAIAAASAAAAGDGGSEATATAVAHVRRVDGTAAADELNLGRQCEYGKAKRLPATKLLIDEVSMMDVPLASALLNAINHHRTSLMLVGDPDQLPPVGPGRPFAAALAAGVLPCLDLRQIYRTAAGSAIVNAAHAINQGLPPAITTWDINPFSAAQDLSARLAALPVDAATGRLQLPSNALFLRLPDGTKPEAVAEVLLAAVNSLATLVDCNMQRDVQVLSPTKRHACGTSALNAHLQLVLNPPASTKPEMSTSSHAHHSSSSITGYHGGAVWRVGDRVVHLVNDPERDVYNGDLGYIESSSLAEGCLTVRYPPRGSNSTQGFHRVRYEKSDINEQLQLAWAVTVHKAQGGEFPVVLMPLEKSAGSFLLRRPLLYTAVTRAKKLLVLVGTDEALQRCIHNTSSAKHSSWAGHSQQQAESGSGWLSEMAMDRFTQKLKAAAAAKGLKPFPRLVYGADGWLAAGQ